MEQGDRAICDSCGEPIKCIDAGDRLAWIHVDYDYDPFARPHVPTPQVRFP